jgi:hypothetical protein
MTNCLFQFLTRKCEKFFENKFSIDFFQNMLQILRLIYTAHLKMMLLQLLKLQLIKR